MVLPEGTDLSKTYLLFSVKDQSPVLGEGLLLGEALLPLADIVKEDGDVSLKVSLWTHTAGAWLVGAAAPTEGRLIFHPLILRKSDFFTLNFS